MMASGKSCNGDVISKDVNDKQYQTTNGHKQYYTMKTISLTQYTTSALFKCINIIEFANP
jgi:hypothetical protein